jgi:hypothetical protein
MQGILGNVVSGWAATPPAKETMTLWGITRKGECVRTTRRVMGKKRIREN